MKKSSIYVVSLIILAGLTTSAVYAAATVVPFTPPYQLQDTTNGNAVRLNIDSNGYVGIGTISPATNLHIVGNFEPSIRITNTAISGSPYVDMSMNQGNNAALFTASSGTDFKFYNGQYSITMAGSNGYVGIGTTSPQQELEVSGSSEPLIRVTNTAMSGSPFIEIGMNAGNNAALFEATSGKDIRFYNGQYSITMAGSNGYVGIGTTSPQQELDVSGSIRLTGNIVSPNDICIGSC